jgi:hypothetical protein
MKPALAKRQLRRRIVTTGPPKVLAHQSRARMDCTAQSVRQAPDNGESQAASRTGHIRPSAVHHRETAAILRVP